MSSPPASPSPAAGCFRDKVVLVTGASRGIGQAILLAFAREGARVVAVSSGDQSDTAARAKELGAEFHSYRQDFASLTRAGADELISRTLADAGRLDVLVNNAGAIRRAPVAEHPEEDWNLLLQVNLSAPFFLSQALSKWWLEKGRDQSPAEARCKVVNIASMLSFQGGVFVPGYTAAKSGLAGLTKAFANELAKERMNFNAVAPGYIATENTRPLREDTERNAAILSRIPQQRWGDPADIAQSVLFLSSPSADYMNGTIMNVDGGWLAR